MQRRTTLTVKEPREAAMSHERPAARELTADVDRPKRIDRYIDYFGSGGLRRVGVTLNPAADRRRARTPLTPPAPPREASRAREVARGRVVN